MNEDERKKIRSRKIAIEISAFDDEGKKNYTRMNYGIFLSYIDSRRSFLCPRYNMMECENYFLIFSSCDVLPPQHRIKTLDTFGFEGEWTLVFVIF